MKFIDWCDKHHVLLAIYPPHSTHRLQPLDVSLFSPLATFYTQQLEEFIQGTYSLLGLRKRDFFGLFWPAYIKAFTAANIASGWLNTGLYPFNPELVISQLTKHPNGNKDEISRPVSNHSTGSSALSSISMRQLRELIKLAANEEYLAKQRKLENTILHLQGKVMDLQKENTGL